VILDYLIPTRRASSASQSLDERIWESFGGRRTTSGAIVNRGAAMGSAAYLRAITFVSDTFAAFPLDVRRRLPGGDKQDASTDPRYSILHNRPNDEMTSFTWRQMAIGNFYNDGNSYSEIVRDAAGNVVALWPIPPSNVTIDRNADNSIVYSIRDDNGTVRARLSHWEILHIKSFTYDGIYGQPILTLARDVIGTALAQQSFAAHFSANGAIPSGVVETPEGPRSKGNLQNLADSWNNRFTGDGRHKTAFLLPGQKYTPIQVSNEQSQFIAAQNFSVKQIASLFGLPSQYLNDAEGATHSNVEQKAIDLVRFLFNSLVRRWEQEINSKLFGDTDLFAEFNLDYLLRGDSQARAEFYAKAVGGPIMSVNEARRKEGLNPVDGGDELLSPLNMGATSAPQGSDQSSIDISPIIADACARVIAKETKQVSAILRKCKDVAAYAHVLADYYADRKGLRAFIAQVFAPITCLVDGFDHDEFSSRWSSSSKGQLCAVIEKSKNADADIVRCFGEWESDRAAKVIDEILGEPK